MSETEQAVSKAVLEEISAVRGMGLVGTAEAARMLGVERPRIGRWLKSGLMPEPAVKTAATPLWTTAQIESIQGEREKRRRFPAVTPCACGCGEDPGVYAKSDKSKGQVKGEPRALAKGHRIKN